MKHLSLGGAIILMLVIAGAGAGLTLLLLGLISFAPVPMPEVTLASQAMAAATQAASQPVSKPASAAPAPPRKVTFNPPKISDAPAHLRDAVTQGHTIILHTREHAGRYVGNHLDCGSCHLKAGLDKNVLSLVGVTAKYPLYDARQGKVIGLIERTNECFERNLNGAPAPANDATMQALLGYYAWISKDIPVYVEIPWLKPAAAAQPQAG